MSGGSKQSFATQLDPGVIQALRSTVIGLQQLDPSLTVGEFVGNAIIKAIEAAQDEHHNGQPWPTTTAIPRRGPRIGISDHHRQPDWRPGT